MRNPRKLTVEEEIKIIKELEEFDTPTITNVVATYPGKSTFIQVCSFKRIWDRS